MKIVQVYYFFDFISIKGVFLIDRKEINVFFFQVIIDDQLFVDYKGELFCFYFNNKSELWVFFIEKAYMKVMGGYDFLGFNLVSNRKDDLDINLCYLI